MIISSRGCTDLWKMVVPKLGEQDWRFLEIELGVGKVRHAL